MATKKKRGRPAKRLDVASTKEERGERLKRVMIDYRSGRTGRIYRDWQAFYQHAAPRLGKIGAKGGATRMMAHKYDLTPRQIQNIVSRGEVLLESITVEASARSKQHNEQHETFRRVYHAIEQATEMLRKPAYKQMLKGCEVSPLTKLPKALETLFSAPAPKDPPELEHWQRLAGTLAQAFLFAHSIAERENPGYSERKIRPDR